MISTKATEYAAVELCKSILFAFSPAMTLLALEKGFHLESQMRFPRVIDTKINASSDVHQFRN